jgi:hypothetical protein
MKTTSMARPQPFAWRRLAGAVIGCTLLGAAAAFVLRPPSLLASAQSGPEQSEDVLGQLYQANLVNTEEGWLAVERNFPTADAYHHNLARQGLIYYYLTRTQDYHKALEQADILLGAAETDFQIFGRAAKIITYIHLGDDEQAYYENQRLEPDMRDVLSQKAPRMTQLLNQALDELADRAL